jgi:geranylgeranyl transferase type-1 subunit beta
MEGFLYEKHVHYFQMHMRFLPHYYTGLDSNRLTALYFCVVGLDLLGQLDLVDKIIISNYVYSSFAVTVYENVNQSGFLCKSQLGFPYSLNQHSCQSPLCGTSVLIGSTQGHLAMTYSALAVLLTIGDDLSRLDRENLVEGIRGLQQENGSFLAARGGCECDVRFTFCACAIAAILNDWSFIDIESGERYILACQSYEGGFGLSPGS